MQLNHNALSVREALLIEKPNEVFADLVSDLAKRHQVLTFNIIIDAEQVDLSLAEKCYLLFLIGSSYDYLKLDRELMELSNYDLQFEKYPRISQLLESVLDSEDSEQEKLMKVFSIGKSYKDSRYSNMTRVPLFGMDKVEIIKDESGGWDYTGITAPSFKLYTMYMVSMKGIEEKIKNLSDDFPEDVKSNVKVSLIAEVVNNLEVSEVERAILYFKLIVELTKFGYITPRDIMQCFVLNWGRIGKMLKSEELNRPEYMCPAGIIKFCQDKIEECNSYKIAICAAVISTIVAANR